MMMKTMKSMTRLAGLALAAVAVSACELGPRLETRTFRLDHMREHEAANLLEPYVFGDRERNPGALSTIEGAITVRETPDNLDRIERVLAEFDTRRPLIRLHFQLIEADGFTESDPRISAVEDELRSIFQFRGYRLAGEATLTAADVTHIEQQLRASDGLFQITGDVYRLGPDATRLAEVKLWSEQGGYVLETTVNIRTGQTLVLGSSPKDGSSATLFLTVRAEEVAGPS